MKKKGINLEAFKSKLSGSVLTADSENYDAARTPWDLAVVQYPELIVMAESAEDIAEAVHFAKETGLKVAVKNTGHGLALPANDSLLIVVSLMNQVRINPDEKTAWVEAGAKWSDVLEQAQAAGLAPLMGSSSEIGAIGYTTGGGMGWLARKYGLAVDSVLSYDVVTADGELIHASHSENADLFWGLSGCGPAFGIITAMEIRLFPVKTVYAGNLIYPREAAREVFAHYKEWITTLEDDWTTSVSLNNFPPVPFIPDFLRGQSVVIVRGCYTGTIEKGAAMIQSWLDWMAPIANQFAPLPFQDVDVISNDPKEPIPATVHSVIVKEMSDEVINTLIDRALPKDKSMPLLFAELYHTGGAMARADKDANAFSHHDAPFILKMIGLTPTTEASLEFTNIINDIKNDIGPYTTGAVYLNFLSGDAKWQLTQAAFKPEVWQKLITLKKKYDPENLFCFSLNIPLDD